MSGIKSEPISAIPLTSEGRDLYTIERAYDVIIFVAVVSLGCFPLVETVNTFLGIGLGLAVGRLLLREWVRQKNSILNKKALFQHISQFQQDYYPLVLLEWLFAEVDAEVKNRIQIRGDGKISYQEIVQFALSSALFHQSTLEEGSNFESKERIISSLEHALYQRLEIEARKHNARYSLQKVFALLLSYPMRSLIGKR